MERVLAILDRKLAEGGGISSSDDGLADRHNFYFRGRWSAFHECAIMLRSALREQRTKESAAVGSPARGVA
jgi:hypothetical protein